jgi:hypothetical protein
MAVRTRMRSSEIVRALAEAWRTLHRHHEQHPEQREELARRTAECLAWLTGQMAQGDPAVADLALTRSVRECERLARAIQTGTALPEATPRPAVEAAEPALASTLETGSLRVLLHPERYAVVEVTGYVRPEDLASALAHLGPLLSESRGALLVDARASRGHDAGCGAVLADWVATGGSLRVRCVAVVVGRGMQFVRASRALAVATGVAWSITHRRERAEAWLTSRIGMN